MDGLLDGGNKGTTDAKWNLFRFQDHLLDWISMSAAFFQQRLYPDAFEALTNVYSDVYGFLEKKEREEIDKLFALATKATSDYLNNSNHQQNMRRQNIMTSLPPSEIYYAVLNLRKALMSAMAQHQLLIPMVKKSSAGAGGA